MGSASSPLVPEPIDYVSWGATALAFVLTIVALVLIARDRHTMKSAVVSLLVVLLLPLLGPIMYFVYRKRAG